MFWKLMLLLIGTSIATLLAQKCDDIDTSACKLLVAQRPDLCSDPALAKSTCPRFCKLCPVECYHCNATVFDYHECNTTMLCGEGEVCMRKELKSYLDGHHEYEMTCANKQICDGGSDLSIPFGKRGIDTRDISITCCADDLCNYPEKPSTTAKGCPKDIVFLVEESSKVLSGEHHAVKNAIIEVVKQLDIGMTENLVAMYGYDTQIHTKVTFQQNTDKDQLLAALQLQSLTDGIRFFRGDTAEAVKFLVDMALTQQSGDRPSFPDAVVIIGDSTTAQNVQLGILNQIRLQKASQDVVVVSVGARSGTSGSITLDKLATDNNHILHVHDMYNTQSFVDKVVPLLLQC